MKTLNVIIKVVVALAAIAGVVYLAATYGDKIVSWAKNLMSKFRCCCGSDCTCSCTCECCEEDQVLTEEVTEEAVEQDFEG